MLIPKGKTKTNKSNYLERTYKKDDFDKFYSDARVKV